MATNKTLPITLGGTRLPLTRAIQSTTHGDTGATPPTLHPAFPWDSAAELDVRESSSAAAHQSDDRDEPAASAYADATTQAPLHEDDDVDHALVGLGIPRQHAPDGDPRELVRIANSFTNPDLGELLVRLSAEHDRVARLCAKQEFIVEEVRHRRRDREVQVRRAQGGCSTSRLDDIVWDDPVYHALNAATLLQQRVLNELEADLVALDRHYAAVSRLIEIRRQEQERDLIDANVAGRRPFRR